MRALVTTGPGALGWQEVETPALPGDDGALVRPLAVARCDLDPLMVTSGMFPGPFTVGHECAAEVAVPGPDSGLREGDVVLVPFQVSCGACGPCRAGRFASCLPERARAGAAFGFGSAGGGHGGAVADLLAVPHARHLLLPPPPGVRPAILALLPDNVTDAWRSVGPGLAEEPRADVLVVGGAGASIGLYAVGWALALGAGSVRYADDDPGRLAVAAALGADTVTVDRTVDPGGQDVAAWPRRFERARIVVENTGTPTGLACALRSVDDQGRCVSVAIHVGAVAVPLLEMYTRGCTLSASRADSRAHLAAVAALVGDGVFDPTGVPLTHRAWDEAPAAWTEPALKVVLER